MPGCAMIYEMLHIYQPFAMPYGGHATGFATSLLQCLNSIERQQPTMLDSLAQLVCIPAKDTLFVQNGVGQGVYWLLKGMAYHQAETLHKRCITHFYVPGQFIMHQALPPCPQGTLQETLLLTNAELIYISMDNLRLLQEQFPQLLQLRIAYSHACQQYRQQERMRFKLLSAYEHYQYLCTHQPMLMHHVQKKDIATYLGVNPSTLSRWISAK